MSAFVGGFASAAAALGRAADLIMLDTTDPQRPRARPLGAALARLVRGRASSQRFIAGQMRHGPRGAAELAETVDRLVAFAHTTGAVDGELFDLLYDAYVADPRVRDFLQRENAAAARAIAAGSTSARRRGLWHPRRNDVEPILLQPSGELRHEAARAALARLCLPRCRLGMGCWCASSPAEGITPTAFAAFCAAARRHGNGTIEIRARGSLQVRGLIAAIAPRSPLRCGPRCCRIGVPIMSDPLA